MLQRGVDPADPPFLPAVLDVRSCEDERLVSLNRFCLGIVHRLVSYLKRVHDRLGGQQPNLLIRTTDTRARMAGEARSLKFSRCRSCRVG
jgi:hypothetical protein